MPHQILVQDLKRQTAAWIKANVRAIHMAEKSKEPKEVSKAWSISMKTILKPSRVTVSINTSRTITSEKDKCFINRIESQQVLKKLGTRARRTKRILMNRHKETHQEASTNSRSKT